MNCNLCLLLRQGDRRFTGRPHSKAGNTDDRRHEPLQLCCRKPQRYLMFCGYSPGIFKIRCPAAKAREPFAGGEGTLTSVNWSAYFFIVKGTCYKFPFKFKWYTVVGSPFVWAALLPVAQASPPFSRLLKMRLALRGVTLKRWAISWVVT